MDGLYFRALKQFPDERGNVLHFYRKSDADYIDFSEAYFSVVNKQVVKGWKMHKEAIQSLVVIQGEVRFVVTNGRDIESFVMSPEKSYGLLRIPNGLYYSFKCESNVSAIIANISTIEHDPNECVIKSLDEFSHLHKW